VTRILTFAGLALTAAGGYVLGRRGVDVRVAVNRAFHHSIPDAQTTEIALRVTRKPGYDTEFDHVAEREEIDRHRIAEELKAQPLHERRARRPRHAEDDLTTAASQPLTREREDIVAPRPY
jgi:hypothetical protein